MLTAGANFSCPNTRDLCILGVQGKLLVEGMVSIVRRSAQAHRLPTDLSVFRTREDPQPTSEFVAACPCPDGLMQDGTQEGG
jgi:hypothetical protein